MSGTPVEIFVALSISPTMKSKQNKGERHHGVLRRDEFARLGPIRGHLHIKEGEIFRHALSLISDGGGSYFSRAYTTY